MRASSALGLMCGGAVIMLLVGCQHKGSTSSSATTRPTAMSVENQHHDMHASAKRYSNDPKADTHKLSADYCDAMRELSKRYPDDLDAATIFAESGMDLRPWHLWSPDGKPAEGTEEIVATLESVLKRNPN